MTGSEFNGLWICTECQAVKNMDSSWRWNGEAWEHKCGDPQAGYFAGSLVDAAGLTKILAERETYRQAIIDAIDYANGRESEWGERAEQAFHFLYLATGNNG